MSSANVVQLKHPITVGGKIVSELSFRRMKNGDARAVERHVSEDGTGDVSMSLLLISRLAGITEAEVDEIDMEDMEAINNLSGLMGKSPTAGTST